MGQGETGTAAAADLIEEAHTALLQIRQHTDKNHACGFCAGKTERASRFFDAAYEAARREGEVQWAAEAMKHAQVANEFSSVIGDLERAVDRGCACRFSPMPECALLASCTFHEEREQAAFRRGHAEGAEEALFKVTKPMLDAEYRRGAREALQRVIDAEGEDHPCERLVAMRDEYADTTPDVQEPTGCAPHGYYDCSICRKARRDVCEADPPDEKRTCDVCGSADPKVRELIGSSPGVDAYECDAPFHAEEATKP